MNQTTAIIHHHQLASELRSVRNSMFIPLRYRWNSLLEQISEQLRSSKALLGLWQRYKLLYGQCVAAVQKQEECADRLLKSATDRDITEEESNAWIKDCNVGRDITQESCIRLYEHFFSQ